MGKGLRTEERIVVVELVPEERTVAEKPTVAEERTRVVELVAVEWTMDEKPTAAQEYVVEKHLVGGRNHKTSWEEAPAMHPLHALCTTSMVKDYFGGDRKRRWYMWWPPPSSPDSRFG